MLTSPALHLRTIVGLALVLTVAAPPGAHAQSADEAPAADAEYLRSMNAGKAFLENRNSADAIAALEKAAQLRPGSAHALRNLGRAYLLARNAEKAKDALTRAADVDPNYAGTAYLLGLAAARRSQFEEALPHFDRAVRLDPHTATLHFQLAAAYQGLQRHDEARVQLLETVRLDPLHASAHFKLSVYARQRGDQQEVETRTREFMRLRKLFGDESRNADALESCVYTRPEPPEPPESPAPAEPMAVQFRDVTETVLPASEARKARCTAVLDVDGEGTITLLTALGDAGYRLLRTTSEGAWPVTEPAPLEGQADIRQCASGDFWNRVPPGEKYDPAVHARQDVIVATSTGPRFLLRTGDDSFEDVTARTGVTGADLHHIAMVDVEHDGDLDVLFSQADGAHLWQNNGDGTFAKAASSVGVAETELTVASAAADLNADVAVDLILARGPAATRIFENLRTGQFRLRPDPPGPLPPAHRVAANDLDNDGAIDIVLADRNRVHIVYGRDARRDTIAIPDMAVAALALVDADNDGRLEVAIAGSRQPEPLRGAVALYRHERDVWRNVSDATGLDKLSPAPITEIHAFDADQDGDTDLTLVTADGLRILRNEGGNANRQLKIRLATVKTNPSGLGTHVEVRAGSFWVTRQITGPPIEIGVGPRSRLDAVQTVWTNGVVDNQVDVEWARRPLLILEKNVATGSCPFLYAWDGERFRFVTDLLGNSPIGLPQSREEMLPADPDEIVWIGRAPAFPPRNGAYALTITDEFREILYLDEARLLAVDHPIGSEAHPTDKIMFPPFPASEVRILDRLQTIRTARSNDGIDRTAALQHLDGVFAPPGQTLPAPYRGMCRPLTLELDFGPVDYRAARVLALTGWLQYGDGSTNIALSQNRSLSIIPPCLEAVTDDGRIVPVDVVIGMPAGKTKTILVELEGKLPPDTRRLRLNTTFDIRWDRIALFEPVAQTAAQEHGAGPSRAHLSWRGFSDLRTRRPGHPSTPDFDKVTDRPAWRRALQGWCTRYGDVKELLAARDDRMVVMNAGDALQLEFDAAAFPPVPQGSVRDFFLYSAGWDKDGDHNVVAGDTVEPLPRADPARSGRRDITPERGAQSAPVTDASVFDPDGDWQLRYNTRWVAGDQFDERRTGSNSAPEP